MKKAAFALIALGVVLIFGSCASCGVALFSAWDARMVTSVPISFGQIAKTELVSVEQNGDARITVHAEVRSKSIQEEKKFGEVNFEPRYRFPVSYKVFSETDVLLLTETATIAWDSGSRSWQTLPSLGDDMGISVDTHLKTFALPKSTRIRVELEIQPDSEYNATATGLELQLYDSISQSGSWAGGSLITFFMGWGLILTGVVLFAFRGLVK